MPMDKLQAANEVGYLKSLFPKMPMEQSDFWTDVFLKYDQWLIHTAINALAETPGEFVDRTKLLNLIKFYVEPATTEQQRVAQAKAEQAAHEKAREEEICGRDRSFIPVANAFFGLSDEKLEELKNAVLANVKPETAAVLKLSDPRTGKALRYLMAQMSGGIA